MLNMELMKEEEAAIVRPRIIEEMEKERIRSWDVQAVCIHCKKPCSFKELKNHAKKEYVHVSAVLSHKPV